MRTERLASEYELLQTITFFPLHPETPPDGRPLADLFGDRMDAFEAMSSRLRHLMEAEGLEYGRRTHTYNSRLAQELGKWAEDQPDGERIHLALYRAYFVDGINLADVDQLVAIAVSVGLDPVAAGSVLKNRAYRNAVDEDWQRAMRLGVTGVPTYMAGRFRVVGAQPYETLEQLVLHAAQDASQ